MVYGYEWTQAHTDYKQDCHKEHINILTVFERDNRSSYYDKPVIMIYDVIKDFP